METKYKRGLNHTYLTLEVSSLYEEDYQLRMIQANSIKGLLEVSGQGIDGKSQYTYEISGKTPLRTLYERTEMNRQELEDFLSQLLETVKAVQSYMLEAGRILLEPEYIFQEEEQYFFCYLPTKEADLCQEFHVLTDYFVKRISHKEQEGIQLAYALHKETMEENYNLEKIIGRLKLKERKKVIYEQSEAVLTEGGNEEITDRISEARRIPYEKENSKGRPGILRDAPVWWRKKKKEKWGDWS